MKEGEFDADDSSPKPGARRHLDGEIQYRLTGEKLLLESIFARAPLARLLNEICNALDRQIGNVVSLVSLAGDGEGDPSAMGMNAALFGLSTFCCEPVLGDHDEALGSLEMYCCVPRCPSAGEFKLIERAKCLAAIAIQREDEVDGRRPGDPDGKRLPEMPFSLN